MNQDNVLAFMYDSRPSWLKDSDVVFFDPEYQTCREWNAFDGEAIPDTLKTYEVIVGKWSNYEKEYSGALSVKCKIELAYVDEFGTWRFNDTDGAIEFEEKINEYVFFTKVLCWRPYHAMPYMSWLATQVYKKNRIYEEEHKDEAVPENEDKDS